MQKCFCLKYSVYDLLSCQAAAQLLSVGMIIHAHTAHSPPVSSVLLQPWFVILVIAGAVERLSGLALGVAMERDWVVLVVQIPSFVSFQMLNFCYEASLSFNLLRNFMVGFSFFFFSFLNFS